VTRERGCSADLTGFERVNVESRVLFVVRQFFAC